MYRIRTLPARKGMIEGAPAAPRFGRPASQTSRSLGRTSGKKDMEKTHRHLAILTPASVRAAEELSVPSASPLQVGELAKATGKTVRAIHLYEDMGLLNPVERSRGRFRLYNAESVERVRWITKLQALGFSLPDMKQLLLEQQGAQTAKEAALTLRGAFVEKLAEVQGKLTELHRLEQELLSSLNYLDACQSACGDHLEKESCPACERHADQPCAPPLVAGAHVSLVRATERSNG